LIKNEIIQKNVDEICIDITKNYIISQILQTVLSPAAVVGTSDSVSPGVSLSSLGVSVSQVSCKHK